MSAADSLHGVLYKQHRNTINKVLQRNERVLTFGGKRVFKKINQAGRFRRRFQDG